MQFNHGKEYSLTCRKVFNRETMDEISLQIAKLTELSRELGFDTQIESRQKGIWIRDEVLYDTLYASEWKRCSYAPDSEWTQALFKYRIGMTNPNLEVVNLSHTCMMHHVIPTVFSVVDFGELKPSLFFTWHENDPKTEKPRQVKLGEIQDTCERLTGFVHLKEKPTTDIICKVTVDVFQQ